MRAKEQILTWLLTHAGVESEYNRNLIYNTLVEKIRIPRNKTRSAKEILEQYRDDSQFPNINCVVFTKDQCISAMEEYHTEGQYYTDDEITIIQEQAYDEGLKVDRSDL